MKNLERRWQECLSDIDEATAALNKLQGEQSALKKELKNFDISTMKEAVEMCASLSTELSDLEDTLEKTIYEISKELESI